MISLKLNDLLKYYVAMLKAEGVMTAALDSEVMLADALQKDRGWLLAHTEENVNSYLNKSELKLLEMNIVRRAQHEPLAYIRGRQEFYGRDFIVSPDTLTPRPETETMIELLCQRLENEEQNAKNKESLQIIDVGTGTGCIIVTAALELSNSKHHAPHISYFGLDISKRALKIARKNAENLQATVTFKEFDLNNDSLALILDPQSSIYVLANLPYVPNEHHINKAATHEPPIAIFGGTDGLDYYRMLFHKLDITARTAAAPHDTARSSKTLRPKNAVIFTESLPAQHKALKKIAINNGFSLVAAQDFIQVFINSTL